MFLFPDIPITTHSDDLLNRSPFARGFVQQVISIDPSSGFVVGVLGSWGSGKTSLLNLAREEFKLSDINVLDYNPWIFSGADQLVESFFLEISAQLKLMPSLKEIGELFESFGDVFSNIGWLPFVGSWIERLRLVFGSVGKVLKSKKGGVTAMREKISAALIKHNKPFVVILDDIDRLSTPEIRDIFKLVRITANFPNIIYILAFDRMRVEQALGEQGISGRDYLEKILQYTVDLPVIPDQVLERQINLALDEALDGLKNPGPFNAEEWPDIFLDIVRPLIRNIRDVRRYVLAVRSTVVTLDGQIALGDVFALEAVRLFLPDVFHRLYTLRDALTTQSRMFMLEDLKHHIDTLLDIDNAHREVVINMLRLLFPTAYRHVDSLTHVDDDFGKMHRERRVAQDTFFDLYFERVSNNGIRAINTAERALQLFSENERLDAFLRSQGKGELHDVFSSMETIVEHYPVELAQSVSVVLLNLLPDVMERELPGRFGIASNYYVCRIVSRFLQAISDVMERESAVRRILTKLTTLSAKLEVITLLRSKNQDLFQWLPEETACALDAEWRAEVRCKLQDAGADWTKEYVLLRVMLVAKKFAGAEEPDLVLPNTPEFTYALLQASRGESSSSMLHRRAVKRRPILIWDKLLELYGDKMILHERIKVLSASRPDDESGVIGLALSYVEGTPPEDMHS